jgi:hypothetical protein
MEDNRFSRTNFDALAALCTIIAVYSIDIGYGLGTTDIDRFAFLQIAVELIVDLDRTNLSAKSAGRAFLFDYPPGFNIQRGFKIARLSGKSGDDRIWNQLNIGM